MNGEERHPPFNFLIASETTEIVDVSDAMAVTGRIQARDARQQEVLNNIVAMAASSITKLNRLNQFALDLGCPGGDHGERIPHGGDMAALSTAVISDLTNAKSTIESIQPTQN
jgi:hypothetical protein